MLAAAVGCLQNFMSVLAIANRAMSVRFAPGLVCDGVPLRRLTFNKRELRRVARLTSWLNTRVFTAKV